MRLLLKGGLLVTMDPARRVIKDGFVEVEGDRITDLGKSDSLGSGGSYDEVLDARGRMIIPGLIDCHTHLFQGLYKGLGDGVRLLDWLSKVISPLAMILDPIQGRAAAICTCIQMIKSGTTCFADSGFIHLQEGVASATAEAALESGLRAVLARASRDIDPTPTPLREDPSAAKKMYRRFHDEWNGRGEGRIQTCPSPLTVFESSAELICSLRELADEYRTGFHIHAASTPETLRIVKDRVGKREIEYLHHLGALKPDTLVAHSVAVSDMEIGLLAKTVAKVAHCPFSNSYLGYGVAAVPAMRRERVTVGLGCDTMACGGNMDMLETMRLAALMHRNNTLDPTVMTAKDVLEMATIDAARALGLESMVGSIEVGKKADIAMINLKSPNIVPVLDPIANLVYSLNGSDVTDVMVDGRVIMRDRVILTFDEAAELEKANLLAESAVTEARVEYLARQVGWRYE